jgi:hypothetical protein
VQNAIQGMDELISHNGPFNKWPWLFIPSEGKEGEEEN